jgi:RES domain-containing protein
VVARGSLTLFRWTSYDVPFWARANTRPGRWNTEREAPTQYWSMTPEAAWAELVRAEDLRTEADLDLVRMPLWVCRIPALGLEDLTDAATQTAHGISAEALVADDWTACQRLASTLRATTRGVMAPSAALDGHANVTIFGGRRAIDWRDRAALARAVPTTQTAIGRPPRGLLGGVRRPADGSGATPLF